MERNLIKEKSSNELQTNLITRVLCFFSYLCVRSIFHLVCMRIIKKGIADYHIRYNLENYPFVY